MAQVDQKQVPADIVYTPGVVSTLTLHAIEDRAKTTVQGVPLCIPEPDKVIQPMRPGDLVTIMGRPSNYKSGVMQYVARKTAQRLDMEQGQCVVYVTWEQAVEEMGVVDLAHATALDAADIMGGKIKDWDELKRAAVRRGALPLFVIGHSFERRRKRPRLTMTAVAQALEYLEDQIGFKPVLACLDYLQRIPGDRGQRAERVQDRRGEMMEVVDRCKDMALACACPVMLGVQAKREVDERKWKLPWTGDGQETSNVEQSSDKMLSVWMPKTSDRSRSVDESGRTVPGVMIGEAPREFEVTDNLLLLAVIKQKFGKSPHWWPLHVDPARNEIADMEVHNVNE